MKSLLAQNDSLLKRNAKMAEEINSIKALNRNLKKLLSKLLNEELSRTVKLVESSTQTEEFSPSLVNISMNMSTPNRLSTRDNRINRGLNVVKTPVAQQVSIERSSEKKKTLRLELSSPFRDPTLEGLTLKERLNRRSARQTMSSYTETPLNAKLRQGMHTYNIYKENEHNDSQSK